MTIGINAGWARCACSLLLLGWSALSTAQVEVPRLSGEVTDLTATLSTEQQSELSQILRTLALRKGTQFAVLVVPTTAPEAIEAFALRVAEEWNIGRKGIDDGAVLVIAKDDRALRIEVGYGLEGALNDAASSRIINEIILPRFKQGDYYAGIKAGVEQMTRVVDGEALPAPAASDPGARGGIGQYAPILFMVALGFGGVLRRSLGKLPGALVGGGVVALVAWFMVGSIVVALIAGVIALVVSLLGLSPGSPATGRYYGGGGGRGIPMGGGFPGGGFGSGGGGFSGGGGGFGGGGASGRW